MNKSTKIKLWIFGFTLLFIGIVIYSGFQPRNPNKVLKTQMKYFGLDYNILKPTVTYFNERACFTDLDSEIRFEYETSNDLLQPFFPLMKPLPVKESVLIGDYWDHIESGYYFIEQTEGREDFELLLIDTLNKQGVLFISIF